MLKVDCTSAIASFLKVHDHEMYPKLYVLLRICAANSVTSGKWCLSLQGTSINQFNVCFINPAART